MVCLHVSLPPNPQTPDGQLVEVEDDDVPTDSDDESSDDGGGAARGRARTARGARTASVRAGWEQEAGGRAG